MIYANSTVPCYHDPVGGTHKDFKAGSFGPRYVIKLIKRSLVRSCCSITVALPVRAALLVLLLNWNYDTLRFL